MDWETCARDKQFFQDIRCMHANRQGVHKCPRKDALTCFGLGCAICVECTTFKCYMCHEDLWECKCTRGNIRLQPELTQIPFEHYWACLNEQ